MDDKPPLSIVERLKKKTKKDIERELQKQGVEYNPKERKSMLIWKLDDSKAKEIPQIG